ncbi:type III secretion system translocon subunit SctE [Paludibacterium purpuratum]|uniref:Secretion system effector C (SseC) family protein n=1 Tax=Paludibacterium purpuratum TaxID=1144873 RepID=A0A4R7B103_9NEIS|nr:type III secretion system translocon subunit SctE [Paludibacterium purpuratum]TDR76638.1 secretion system effector C (SseC) family protein [Paludibacterium purpuratum]
MTIALSPALPSPCWSPAPAPSTPPVHKAPSPGLRPAADDSLGRPPAPRRQVTAQEADQSLQRLVERAGLPPSVKQSGLKSVAELMATITLNASSSQLKLAEVSADGQQQIVDAVKTLRSKQSDELNEKIAKAQEDQKKAQKAGILNVVFDWVIAASKIVIGIAKVLTGNVVSGIADLAGGTASIVKAAAATALLVNPDDKTAQKVYDAAGKVELAFDVIGFGLGRGVLNAVKRGAVSAVSGANGVGQSAIGLQRAELQKEIATLSAHMGLFDTWIRLYKDDTAVLNDDIQDKIKQAGQIQQKGLKALNDLGAAQRMVIDAR